MDFFTRELFLGVVMSAFWLAIAPEIFPHLFPHLKKTGNGLPATVVELISRYVWGVASLLAGFGLWLWLIDLAWITTGLLAISAVGGFVVVGRYFSKWLERLRDHDEMTVANDKELK